MRYGILIAVGIIILAALVAVGCAFILASKINEDDEWINMEDKQ